MTALHLSTFPSYLLIPLLRPISIHLLKVIILLLSIQFSVCDSFSCLLTSPDLPFVTSHSHPLPISVHLLRLLPSPLPTTLSSPSPKLIEKRGGISRQKLKGTRRCNKRLEWRMMGKKKGNKRRKQKKERRLIFLLTFLLVFCLCLLSTTSPALPFASSHSPPASLQSLPAVRFLISPYRLAQYFFP